MPDPKKIDGFVVGGQVRAIDSYKSGDITRFQVFILPDSCVDSVKIGLPDTFDRSRLAVGAYVELPIEYITGNKNGKPFAFFNAK